MSGYLLSVIEPSVSERVGWSRGGVPFLIERVLAAPLVAAVDFCYD
jgi:hypothetical protein